MHGSMSYRNPTIWLILAGAIAAGLGLWLGQRMSTPDREAAPMVNAQASNMQAAVLYPTPKPIAPFQLVKGDGSPYTNADLKGQWTLMFFGFTRCPDVCPTTLASFSQLEKTLALTPDSPKVGYLFVSVDPERDTPEASANYAKYFSPSIVAATGEPDAIAAFTRDVGVLYMKAPQPNAKSVSDYTVDHSAQLVLVGPDGTVRGLFRPPLDPNKIAADLRALANEA
jgi:protein SCO1